MKTDDLITLLARDTTPVKRNALPMTLGLLAIPGVIIAFLILVPWLGLRPDLAEAVGGMTYWMKTLYTLGLGVAGFALAERLARPGAKGVVGWAMIAVFTLALAAIAVSQLMATPSGEMMPALLGSTWDKCPWRIVVLSVPGLAAALFAMRRFAPTRPALAGTAAGLLAGGLGATVYGLHCAETAAPFVMIWYSLGVALTAALGAIVGSRLLRW